MATDWEAILRGAGQGATLGWGDEVAARILAALPNDDGTGIPREYAGGQYEQYRDDARRSDAEAQARAPGQFLAGQVVGGAPAAIATSPLGGGATTAARIAASGLQGGALGGLGGAGASTAEDTRGVMRDAATGAAMGGGLGVGAAGAPAALSAARDLGQNAARGLALGQLQPAFAVAGKGARAAGKGAAQIAPGIHVVKAVPPRPDGEEIPVVEIPRLKNIGTRKASFQDASGGTIHDVDVPYAESAKATARPGRGAVNDAPVNLSRERALRTLEASPGKTAAWDEVPSNAEQARLARLEEVARQDRGGDVLTFRPKARPR